MSSTMYGMRGKTHSRTNTARCDATRLAFIGDDMLIDNDDFRQHSWSQERGPEALEPTVNWIEEYR